MSDQTDVLQGTLDLLILRTIAPEPMHGWAISERLQQVSRSSLQVPQWSGTAGCSGGGSSKPPPKTTGGNGGNGGPDIPIFN